MPTRPLAAASIGRTARLAAAVLAGLTLAACEGPPSAPVAAHSHVTATAGRAPLELTPRARRELAALRAATPRFHDPDAATAAGHDAELTGCMSNPPAGAMGLHVGDTTKFDARAVYDAPEILMYEPLPDGRRRLVGVEFAVPFDAWTHPEPPVLFGQRFHRNELFGLWVLHAWVWRQNPNGLFADWNPRVSCEED